MKTTIPGYPRIGNNRELKKSCENYWAGKIPLQNLLDTGKNIRKQNWLLQQSLGIDIIPSNDFSFYDQVLDMTLAVGAIPPRYKKIKEDPEKSFFDLYFAMARGIQDEHHDAVAMEMTKWFNTNYHYIVPELYQDQEFELFSHKIIDEFREAKALGIITKPVILGPVSYLLLGKIKGNDFNPLSLLNKLLPVYVQLLELLKNEGAEWIQFDEPFLAMDLNPEEKNAFKKVYTALENAHPELKIFLATYFEGVEENLETVLQLPVKVLHIDLINRPEQLEGIIEKLPTEMALSLGVVDGRNIWKNDFQKSLDLINSTRKKIGDERIFIASSCSLLHVPCDLESENDETILPIEIKEWMAFAKQKLEEIVTLKKLILAPDSEELKRKLQNNKKSIEKRKKSALIHNPLVKNRLEAIKKEDSERLSIFTHRKELQQKKLNLPLFPTTTIGSFPQTMEIRKLRADFKKNKLSRQDYERELQKETINAIRLQEEIGIDVLVHGEFERNDMVEYFGELLNGYAFTQNGWVQSYGSRCVKPPIIYGDVTRKEDLTVKWAEFAQNQTNKPMKGMLTGPVTMLQWSFVRDDQPRSVTCTQIALAIRDEVLALENAGITIIQIDEPALREGLPLRTSDWEAYLSWAVIAFKISSCGVKDSTQIHTHMCYSDFNDIIEHIANLDADVITIETSRSEMELLDAFVNFKYPNAIGPGVYDIHSPRVPGTEEMEKLLQTATAVLPREHIWVNPDCGLKTRKWPETKAALINMVNAAKKMRSLALAEQEC